MTGAGIFGEFGCSKNGPDRGGFSPGAVSSGSKGSIPPGVCRSSVPAARLELRSYRCWKLSGMILEISSEPHEVSRELRIGSCLSHFQQRPSCQTCMEPVFRHGNVLGVVLRNNRTLIPFRSACTLRTLASQLLAVFTGELRTLKMAPGASTGAITHCSPRD
jgi:hypothetical protein